MATDDVRPTPAAERATPWVCAVCGRRFATEAELRHHGRDAGLVG